MATNDIKANEKSQKVIFVGDDLSGKSSLLMSFLHNHFIPNQSPAVGETYYKEVQIDSKSINLSLVEVPVNTIFDRLRPLSYANTNIVLIFFNVDTPESITNVIEKWIPEVRHFCGLCPVILVACKTDLRTDPETIEKLNQQGEKLVTSKVGRKTASKIHADAYMECSAKNYEGVQELFIHAARLSFRKHHYEKNRECILQ